MRIKLGRLYIQIQWIGPSPFEMGKRERRKLAERILLETDGKPSMISRCKVLRSIAQQEGWDKKHGFGLRQTKDWIQQVFENHGSGHIRI